MNSERVSGFADAGPDEGLDRVLVVDDDHDIVRALERVLRRLGYEVRLAADGEEGLLAATEWRPNVIITDIRMPNMDGHTLLRRLASVDVDAGVIMTSAHGTMDDVIDSVRNGAIDYLKKPWTTAALAAAVARAADLNHARRERGPVTTGTFAVVGPAANDTGPAPAPPTVAGSAFAGRTEAPGRAAPPTVVAPPPPPIPMRASVSSVPHVPPPLPAAGEVPGAPVAAVASRRPHTLAELVEQIRRGEVELPVAPAVVGQVRTLLADPRSQLDVIVRHIERDPQLLAQVLKLANSAQYSRHAKATDLRGALGRIGLRPVQSIVETTIARGFNQARDPGLRAALTGIWRFSVARAVAMRQLAQVTPSEQPLDGETAYVSGIVADLGASFLLTVFDERRAAGACGPLDAASCLESIRDYHPVAGAALLTRWGLSPIVCAVAGAHHRTPPPGPAAAYARLLGVADAVATVVSGAPDLTCGAAPSAAVVAELSAALGLGAEVLERTTESARAEFEAVVDALS